MGKRTLSYAGIVERVRRSRREYARLCASHYAFIDRRFGAANHHALSEFVQGAMMRFRGDGRAVAKNKGARALSKRLLALISEAPKSRGPLVLFRAHHFATAPRVGAVVAFDVLTSATMAHSFAVEWLAARPHDENFKPVMLVIRVPARAGGLLCVGCPEPHACSVEHQRTFRVGPRSDWAYEPLNQDQLQNQSEVVLSPGSYRVTAVSEFRMRDVHNLNRYGLGWYENVRNQKVNQDKSITCVFVDRLTG